MFLEALLLPGTLPRVILADEVLITYKLLSP